MNKLIIKSADFDKMPYASTNVPWTKTKGDCEGILFNLRSKGILKIHGWVTEGEADDDVDTLYMELEIPVGEDQLRTINLKFEPTMIYTEHWKGAKKRGDKRMITRVHKNTSWRLFFWHFKSKMEAVQYGLVTLENEFMSNIMHYLKDESGKITGEVTFGEALKMMLLEDKVGLLLEDKSEPQIKAKVIEAEVLDRC